MSHPWREREAVRTMWDSDGAAIPAEIARHVAALHEWTREQKAQIDELLSKVSQLEYRLLQVEQQAEQENEWEEARENRHIAAAERHDRDLADLERKQRDLENDRWAEQQKRQDAERRQTRGW